jgi:hypothetical protein
LPTFQSSRPLDKKKKCVKNKNATKKHENIISLLRYNFSHQIIYQQEFGYWHLYNSKKKKKN